MFMNPGTLPKAEIMMDVKKQRFSAEQIEQATGLYVGQSDFDAYASATDETTNQHSILSRSRNSWWGLAKCYWYTSHEHPLHLPPPALPNLPLQFENTGQDITQASCWRLDTGSLMDLINSYDAYKAMHPEQTQTDILSRHMWNASLEFLTGFATFQLEDASDRDIVSEQ